MTKEELITLGLTEEQTAKILSDYGKNYVSKAQFNAKNEECKEAKREAEFYHCFNIHLPTLRAIC